MMTKSVHGFPFFVMIIELLREPCCKTGIHRYNIQEERLEIQKIRDLYDWGTESPRTERSVPPSILSFENLITSLVAVQRCLMNGAMIFDVTISGLLTISRYLVISFFCLRKLRS